MTKDNRLLDSAFFVSEAFYTDIPVNPILITSMGNLSSSIWWAGSLYYRVTLLLNYE